MRTVTPTRIELYDAVPKYFSDPKLMASLRKDGKFLLALKREFEHKGERYTLYIRPARIIYKNGDQKEYSPRPREELVEEALRKIACDRLKGVYLDDGAGVQFTLYELKKELRERGHDINSVDLVESLKICNLTNISFRQRMERCSYSPLSSPHCSSPAGWTGSQSRNKPNVMCSLTHSLQRVSTVLPTDSSLRSSI